VRRRYYAWRTPSRCSTDRTLNRGARGRAPRVINIGGLICVAHHRCATEAQIGAPQIRVFLVAAGLDNSQWINSRSSDINMNNFYCLNFSTTWTIIAVRIFSTRKPGKLMLLITDYEQNTLQWWVTNLDVESLEYNSQIGKHALQIKMIIWPASWGSQICTWYWSLRKNRLECNSN
jgi:hypothetical protein